MMSYEMKKNKTFFTFDFELFLGSDSGSLNDCLVNQTEEILKIFAKHNAIALFFIDASYLLKLYETNDDDFIIFTELIKKIVNKNHDIGLHLHPHWLDAIKKENGSWDLSNTRYYKLHNINDLILGHYINKCFNLLNSIVIKENPKYKISSFRAGGWCITPFYKLKDHFKTLNIKYDFSVQPGNKLNHGSLHSFNFTSAPKNLSFWRFSEDVNSPDENGYFIEIPITRYKLNPILFLINKYYYSQEHKLITHGKSASYSTIFEKIKKLLTGIKYASFDDISLKLSNKIFNKIDQNHFSTYVGHPKSFSINNYKILDALLERNTSISLKEFEMTYLDNDENNN